MKLYAIKVGFYEELAGIFDNETKAKDIASKIDEAKVCELELNKLTNRSADLYYKYFHVEIKRNGKIISCNDYDPFLEGKEPEIYGCFRDCIEIMGIKSLSKEDAMRRANSILIEVLNRGEWGKDEK